MFGRETRLGCPGTSASTATIANSRGFTACQTHHSELVIIPPYARHRGGRRRPLFGDRRGGPAAEARGEAPGLRAGGRRFREGRQAVPRRELLRVPRQRQ